MEWNLANLPSTPTMVDTFPTGLHIPPLENGDRLSRHEFERRYQSMPDLKKAELIEGVVYKQDCTPKLMLTLFSI